MPQLTTFLAAVAGTDHAAKRVIDATIAQLRSRYNAARQRGLISAARLRRHLLTRTLFVGVTGSAGKTTTKELIVAILSQRWRGGGSYITENRPELLARMIWDLPTSHEFCVAEMSATRPGMIGQSLAIVRPRMGVVTTIGDDHLTAFASRDAIAKEKGKLIAALPADGVAILNADDERVLGMRSRCAGRVVTYGLSPDADVRPERVTGTWPDRLEFAVTVGAEQLVLHTQLCGTHWTSPVLAAIATSMSLGVPIRDCVSGIANTPPLLGRMEPVTDGAGVTFIRDDWKAPAWTIDAAFDFMSRARARRKVIVVGTLSDYSGKAADQYARVADRVANIADHVVFVGPWASRAFRAKTGPRAAVIRAFSTVRHASDYLNTVLESGDLVLLKGTNAQDHLVRIILARTAQVECWRDDCGRRRFCDSCKRLSVPSGLPSSGLQAMTTEADRVISTASSQGLGAIQVVIGLGNPDAGYAATPHNIGQEVVDRLCDRLQATWVRNDGASIARTRWAAHDVLLVKLESGVNVTGFGIKTVSERLGFDLDSCILVHDDLDLPLGSVRVRRRGSAGGHRGVASVQDAFQTDVFRRVKVGIGRPEKKEDVEDYVLRPFPPADRPIADRACGMAVDRILALISEGAASPTSG